jgi:hypothetical protein
LPDGVRVINSSISIFSKRLFDRSKAEKEILKLRRTFDDVNENAGNWGAADVGFSHDPSNDKPTILCVKDLTIQHIELP